MSKTVRGRIKAPDGRIVDGNKWTSDLDLRCKIAYRLI